MHGRIQPASSKREATSEAGNRPAQSWHRRRDQAGWTMNKGVGRVDSVWRTGLGDRQNGQLQYLLLCIPLGQGTTSRQLLATM
jgi:hypothetical protein